MHHEFFLPLAIAAFFAALNLHAEPSDVLKSLNPAIAVLAQPKLAAGKLAQVTIVCTADNGSSLLLQRAAQTAAMYHGD